MKRQSLNVNIQPIMVDMNSIIESHINDAVREFNIQYITREILEHEKKIDCLKEELMRIRNGESIIDENIKLEINDKECDEKLKTGCDITKNKDATTVSVDETKTNKVVSMGDDTQTKKVTINYFDQFVSKPETKEDQEIAVPELETNNKQDNTEDDEEGVFEIEVDGVSYYTTDETNGDLYAIDVNGDPEDVVGKLIDGEAVFNKDI